MDFILDAYPKSDLGKQSFFGGDNLTAADITLVYPMYAARDRGVFDVEYPNISSWFARIESTASYVAARAKDGRERINFQSG